MGQSEPLNSSAIAHRSAEVTEGRQISFHELQL